MRALAHWAAQPLAAPRQQGPVSAAFSTAPVCHPALRFVPVRTGSVRFRDQYQGNRLRAVAQEAWGLGVDEEVVEERHARFSGGDDTATRRRRGSHGLAKGKVTTGVIQSVQPYGALVQLGGGVTGLLHVSKISHERINDINDVFLTGDEVKVLVLGHDRERGRVELSTKELEPEPGDMLRDPALVFERAEETAQQWRSGSRVQGAGEQRVRRSSSTRASPAGEPDFLVGQVVSGVVQSLQQYGAFVELDGGVTGLLHNNQISHTRVDTPIEILKVGDHVKVLILGRDLKSGRPVLSTKKLEPAPGDMLRDPQMVFENAEETVQGLGEGRSHTGAEQDRADISRFEVGQVASGVVTAVVPMFGAFLDLGGGVKGLVHIADFSHAFIGSIDEVLSEGDEVKALVVAHDHQQDRVRLSTRELERSAGDMLRDRQAVFERAEETAQAWRSRREEQGAGKQRVRRPSRARSPSATTGELKYQVGDVATGVVKSRRPYGALVELAGGATGLLHITQISEAHVRGIENVLSEGDEVKVLVLDHDRELGRLSLSTKALEPSPGDMLRKRALVFERAEQTAEQWRRRHEERGGRALSPV